MSYSNQERTMNKFLLCTLVSVMSVAAFDVLARELVAPSDSRSCEMVETATLGVSFNQVPVKLDGFQEYINMKRDEIFNLAADLQITDIVLQNMNYNINYFYNNGFPRDEKKDYVMNGNLSFQMKDADKAPLLMEKVGALGYQVNFNVNAYRQCR